MSSLMLVSNPAIHFMVYEAIKRYMGRLASGKVSNCDCVCFIGEVAISSLKVFNPAIHCTLLYNDMLYGEAYIRIHKSLIFFVLLVRWYDVIFNADTKRVEEC